MVGSAVGCCMSILAIQVTFTTLPSTVFGISRCGRRAWLPGWSERCFFRSVGAIVVKRTTTPIFRGDIEGSSNDSRPCNSSNTSDSAISSKRPVDYTKKACYAHCRCLDVIPIHLDSYNVCLSVAHSLDELSTRRKPMSGLLPEQTTDLLQ